MTAGDQVLSMYECPRFAKCSAPICPLDADWPQRTHLNGDPVCIWLTELAKPQGAERVQQRLGVATTRAVETAYPLIAASDSNIRIALARAATTGSKLEAERRNLENILAKRRQRCEESSSRAI